MQSARTLRAHDLISLMSTLHNLPATQREADAAAERASHWCSLAEVLQRSALLPDAPASPASLGSPFGSTPASSASSSLSALRQSADRSGSGSGSGATASGAGPSPVQRLLADWQRSPASLQLLRRQAERRPSTADRYAGVSGSLSSSEEGPGLIAAFQAVAAQAPAEAVAEEAEEAGSSPVRPCESPPQHAARASPAAAAKSASSGGRLAESSDLAPGSHLRLLTRLAAPGLSFGAASTESPLTPVLAAALPGKGELGAGSGWLCVASLLSCSRRCLASCRCFQPADPLPMLPPVFPGRARDARHRLGQRTVGFPDGRRERVRSTARLLPPCCRPDFSIKQRQPAQLFEPPAVRQYAAARGGVSQRRPISESR